MTRRPRSFLIRRTRHFWRKLAPREQNGRYQCVREDRRGDQPANDVIVPIAGTAPGYEPGTRHAETSWQPDITGRPSCVGRTHAGR